MHLGVRHSNEHGVKEHSATGCVGNDGFRCGRKSNGDSGMHRQLGTGYYKQALELSALDKTYSNESVLKNVRSGIANHPCCFCGGFTSFSVPSRGLTRIGRKLVVEQTEKQLVASSV